IYIKRDDYAGISQFGGNKIRKLEYLLQDAVNGDADTVITYGASQSNHAMQTAAACIRLGLNPLLFLVNLQEENEVPMANMILNSILGAEIHMEPCHGESFGEGLKRSRVRAARRIRELEEEGHRCYEIPMGGATALGSIGFVEGFIEVTEQMEEMGLSADHLFHASGSGGTLAGLAAGKCLTGSPVRIHGVGVGISHEKYMEEVCVLANEALDLLHSSIRVTIEDFLFHEAYGGPGYEKPGRESIEAMKLLARTEGLFLDPVYTAKAFSGMLDQIEKGVIERGSTVVFWHTGGVQALFAEKEILGSLT
ncbi:MAG TPA: D-cysteine desulfhydrase family protein, partial [Clostridiaceae bacterium]|nr:D-cysteine desulfhydrase family protein [Clostridiaceae bacterium]